MMQTYAATDAEDFPTPGKAQGGRIGYADGGLKLIEDKTDHHYKILEQVFTQASVISNRFRTLFNKSSRYKNYEWALLEGVRPSRKQGRI